MNLFIFTKYFSVLLSRYSTSIRYTYSVLDTTVPLELFYNLIPYNF